MKKLKQFFDKTTTFALIVTMLFGFVPVQAGAVTALDASVDSFILVDPVTDMELYEVVDGGYINLASLSDPSKVNIKAETSGSGAIGSVHFELDAGVYTRNENVAPYALFGDSPAYDYTSGSLNIGPHTLEATPRSGSNNTGDYGTELDISFTVVNDTTKPTAAVISPTAPDYLSGGFAVCGTSSDDTMVDYVQVRFQDPSSWSYINNGFKAYPNVAGEWCVDVNGVSGNDVPDGVWGIRLVVKDIWGNSFNNLKFAPYTIDNSKPTGSINSPTDGYLVVNNSNTKKGFVTITGSATDALSGIDTTRGEVKLRTLEKKTNGARVAETNWKSISFVGDDFTSAQIETTDLPSRDDYEVAVVVYDKAGNSKWLWPRPVIEVDNTPPLVSFDDPTTQWVNGEIDIVGSVVDDNPDHYYLVIKNSSGTIVDKVDADGIIYHSSSINNGLLWDDYDTNGLSDGQYTVVLTARDAANNKDGSVGDIGDSYKEKVIYVDNTAPSSDQTALNKLELYDGKIDYTDLKIELEASDTGVGLGYIEYSATKDGVAYKSEQVPQSPGDVLVREFDEEGVYVLKYHAVDELGNSEPEKTITFTIDKTAPVITLSGDNPLEITQGGSYTEPGYSADETVTWTITDNIDTNTVGSYSVNYEALDAAGNIETDERVVVVVPAAVAGTDEGAGTTGTVATLATGGPDEGAEVAGATDEEEAGEVAGGTDESVDGEEENQESDVAEVFGIAWYWWFLIVLALAGGTYWYFGNRRSKK